MVTLVSHTVLEDFAGGVKYPLTEVWLKTFTYILVLCFTNIRFGLRQQKQVTHDQQFIQVRAVNDPSYRYARNQKTAWLTGIQNGWQNICKRHKCHTLLESHASTQIYIAFNSRQISFRLATWIDDYTGRKWMAENRGSKQRPRRHHCTSYEA